MDMTVDYYSGYQKTQMQGVPAIIRHALLGSFPVPSRNLSIKNISV